MKDSRQVLLSYINCSYKEDIYYSLGNRLLEIASTIPNSSIDTIAQLCFVSNATLSRFCRVLGFNNFVQFKEGFIERPAITNYDPNFIKQSTEDLLEASIDKWESIHTDVIEQVNSIELNILDNVVRQIHDNSNIIFLGQEILQFYGAYIQQSLLYAGKLTRTFFQDIDTYNYMKTITDPTLVIIFSLGGTYLDTHPELIDILNRDHFKVLVFTQNKKSTLATLFENNILLPGDNSNDTGKFSLLFLLDILITHYNNRYPKRP